MRVRLFGCVNDFLQTGVKFPVADIVRDGPGKQIGVTRLTGAEHTLKVPNRCIMAVSPAKREKSGSLKGLGSISEAFHTFG